MKRETKSAWADVIESVRVEPFDPKREITAHDFADRAGFDRRRAGEILNHMTTAGRATKRFTNINGRRMCVYALSAKG
jgi:hypothetical protein